MFTTLLVAAVFSVVFAAQPLKSAPTADPAAFSRLYFGLQPPLDREAERAVELVEELTAAGRLSEAAPLIDRGFGAAVDHLGADGESLKRRLLRAVLEAQPSGDTVLRSVLFGEYQRALGRSSSPAELRALIGRYPPELFGVDALQRLAQAESDAGAYASAASALRLASRIAEAQDDRPTAERLARLEAVQRLRLGQDVDAETVAPEALAQWREALSSEAAITAGERAPRAWLAAGGDARRQATAPGQAPTPWRVWLAEIDGGADDPQGHRGGEAFARPEHETVAANGLVITTTTDGLVATSAESGKRLWTVTPPASGHDGRFASLKGLATDTRLVFALEPTSDLGASEGDLSPLERARLFSGGARSPTATNCLAAYEIATGGKLRWRINGRDPSGATPGVRFLGAPAVVDGRLYAIAELEQTVRLLELDADTGRLLWNQPLVQCERPADPRGASVGVSPTLGDGLIYCPTGRGAIAAVDPLRRRLEWVRYLSVDEETAAPAPQRGWGAMGRSSRRWSGDAPGWWHCRVLEADGRLVVASPALPSLQAFDAATGEPLWQVDLEQGVLLGAIAGDSVLTVEADAFSAWRLSDGKTRWTSRLSEGERPAGEGLLLPGRYVLPLTSGKLAVFDSPSADEAPARRTIDLRLNPFAAPPRLGDLLFHAGAILSRSATTLESFHQAHENPSASDEAVIAMAAGEDQQAIALLRQAIDRNPADQRLAERLAAALLRSTREEQPSPPQVGDEMARLVAGSAAQAFASTLRLQAAAEQGRPAQTLAEAVAIATGRAGQVVLHPDANHWVVARRVAAERVRRLWDSLTPQERDSLYDTGRQHRLRLDSSQQQAALDALFAPIEAGGVRTAGIQRAAQPSAAWTVSQIEASVQTDAAAPTTRRTHRTRQDRGAKLQRVVFAQEEGPTRGPTHWSVETRGGGSPTLIGANDLGERVFAGELPGDPATSGIDKGALKAGGPGNRRWGDWLALKVDSGFVVYSLGSAASVQPADSATWESTRGDPAAWPADAAESEPSEAPVAIGPWGVVSIAGGTLRCRDLMTGDLLWRRDLIPSQEKEIRVLAFDDTLGVATEDAGSWLVSAWTGETLNQAWDSPPYESWRVFANGRLLIEQRDNQSRQLKILAIDPAAGKPVGAALWEGVYPLTSRLVLDGPRALLVSDELELTLIDVAVAEEKFTVRVGGPAEPPVRAVRLSLRHGRLLVAIDRTNPMVDRVRGASALGEDPLLTGELHCLDPATGRSLWAGPVEIDGMGLIDTAASQAPLLLLGRRLAPKSDDDQAESQIALVALDLRSGATLYRNHALPAGDERDTAASFWAQYERINQQSGSSQRSGAERLLIRAGRSWVTLQTSDQPAPPRPPMLARVEDPDASRPNDAQDIGRGVERLLKSFWEGDDD